MASSASRLSVSAVSRTALGRALLVDALVAALFVTMCLVVTAKIADEGGERYDSATVALIVVVGGALAIRRVAPRTSLVVTVVGLIVHTLADHAGGPIYLASLVPLYTIAAQGNRTRTYAWAAATMVTFAVVGMLGPDPAHHLIYLVAYAGWASGAVFLGTTQFNRRAYLEQLEQRARDLEDSRDEEARRRVAEERLRIARDLHDVLAHGLATIHMHAAAALHVHERHPEEAVPALQAIKGQSKQALDEVRGALGVLRSDREDAAPLTPAPTVRDLPTLVETTRQAGLDVELEIEPSLPSMPSALEVTIYRIVQESLANVMRHAGPNARARIGVRLVDDALAIEVVDDGLGGRGGGPAPKGGGHGILGMQERAATVGGTLEAGPAAGGGFEVHALLPLRATVSAVGASA
jgi:signal transduction histidine kinase